MSSQQGKKTGEKVDPSLLTAWQRMLDYDVVSSGQRTDFRNFRQMVVWITWIAGLIGIAYHFTPQGTWQRGVLQVMLIALPFLGLAFMNFASEFAGTTTWIEYRKAAEMIRSAIYRYRFEMTVNPPKSDEEVSERQMSLRRAVLEADRWIRDQGVGVPHMRNMKDEQILEEIADSVDGKTPYGFSGRLIPMLPRTQFVNRVVNKGILFVNLIFRIGYGIWGWLLTVLSMTRQTRYESALPKMDNAQQAQDATKLEPTAAQGQAAAAYTSSTHKGFTSLNMGEYIEERLSGQRNWYVNRIDKDFTSLRRTRFLILLLSVVVSVMSVFDGGALLVPVIASLATAFTLLANIDMIGRTYASYQSAAETLQSLVEEWRTRTSAYRADMTHQIDFVKSVEKVLRDENDRWRDASVEMQQMNEVAIYRNLQEFVKRNKIQSRVSADESAGAARVSTMDAQIVDLELETPLGDFEDDENDLNVPEDNDPALPQDEAAGADGQVHTQRGS